MKHVLVFTKAGKPVWARHGDEEVTSALMGILYTMFSIVEETDDELHEIELGGGRKMVYYHVEPLILGIVLSFYFMSCFLKKDSSRDWIRNWKTDELRASNSPRSNSEPHFWR